MLPETNLNSLAISTYIQYWITLMKRLYTKGGRVPIIRPPLSDILFYPSCRDGPDKADRMFRL